MKLLRALGLTLLLVFLLSSAALAQDATEEPAEPTEAPTQMPAAEAEGETPTGPGREIAIGATVEGTLGPEMPMAVYHFIAEAGQIVTITMSSNDLDAYLRLGDQRGNQLLFDDDSADDLDARIGPVQLPESGAYVVIASSFDNIVSEGADIETGKFTLTLTANEPEEISYPAEIEGTLADGEVLHLYSFEGTMGDVLSISLNSDDFDPLLMLTEAANITAPTVRDDDSGPGLNSLIVPYIVPATGTYLLTAISYREDVGGDYTLSIAPLEAEPIAYGDSVDLSLSREGTPVGVFQFEAADGDTVDIIVTSATELDTTLTVLGPDGAQIAFNDDTTGRNPAAMGLALPGTGTYTFVVQPFTRGRSGDITVQLALSAGA